MSGAADWLGELGKYSETVDEHLGLLLYLSVGVTDELTNFEKRMHSEKKLECLGMANIVAKILRETV